MKRLVTLVISTLFLSLTVKAQSPGPTYRQFFFNPYLFNSAYVAINNRPEANLVYRQQWTNFKDAPVTAGFNLQMPTNERVALGFSVNTDKQVLVRSSNVMATFGYIVPIADNQTLRFGLSGGVGMNKLDLSAEEINANDPVLMNAAGNNFYIDGNFGVAYTYSGLRLGFALTDLFNSKSINSESFNKFKLSNMKNRLFSASYRFGLDKMGNFSLEPYALYRQTEDGLQDSWEVASLLYYQDKFWTGAGYNQNNGLSLFLGMNVKDKFRFSYSYDFPPFTSGFTSSSSHELHISMFFNTKKSIALAKKASSNTYAKRTTQKSFSKKFFAQKQPAKKNVELANANKTEETQNDKVANQLAKTQEDTTTLSERNQNPERIAAEQHQPKYVIGEQIEEDADETVTSGNKKTTQPKQTTAKLEKSKVDLKAVEKENARKKEAAKSATNAPGVKLKESFTMSPGHYYVIVGVFKELNGSVRFSKTVKDNGFPVNVALNPKNNMYYVYIQATKEIDEAKKTRNEYRKKNLFKESWIFSLDQ